MGLLMMALNHPTCRQQTKDRAVSLALDLKSKFSADETEGILQWAKASNIEEVAASWLSSGASLSLTGRKKGKREKAPRRPRRKGKAKPKISRKSRKKKAK